MFEKSDDLLMYQHLLAKARRNGNRNHVGWYLRCAADYRQRDANTTPRERDDWVDRCGW